jgi:hypothetical protein
VSLVSKASQNGDAIGGRLPNRSTIHDKSIFRLMTKAIRSLPTIRMARDRRVIA